MTLVALAPALTHGQAADAKAKLRVPASLTEQAPPTYKAKFDTSKGAFVIDTHERPETNHIGDENGGQPSFDALSDQSGAPNRTGRIDHRLSGPILTVNARG